jgi:hypothetical protein
MKPEGIRPFVLETPPEPAGLFQPGLTRLETGEVGPIEIDVLDPLDAGVA